MNPTGKGGPKKGEVRNPNGRPRAPEIELVREAMAATEKEKKKSLWKHLIERAYEEDNVLIAVSKKFIPDQIGIELKDDFAAIVREARQRLNDVKSI